MSDCARIKWYILLASSFISAMALKSTMAPWRRSALLNVDRFDGRDLVRRCLKAPPGRGLWCGPETRRRAVASPSAWESRSEGARGTPSCWKSNEMPRPVLSSSEGATPTLSLRLRPCLARAQSLPTPYHTYPVTHLASFAMT